MSALAKLIAEHEAEWRGYTLAQMGGTTAGAPGLGWVCVCGVVIGANRAEWRDHLAAVLTDAGYGDLAAERERIAVAIEAEFSEWCNLSDPPITIFPTHSGQWLVKGAYESAARAARDSESTP